jgi:hypothetical protein
MMEETDDYPAEIEEKSGDIEICDYLLKKTSKGYFVNRFFATKNHYLKYWSDKQSYENDLESSESYDICEVKNIERPGNRALILYFMNAKFKLELKGLSDEQCNNWTELLIAKKSLYSIDELMVDLIKQKITFATRTFQILMILKEKDQNKWILQKLDEAFEGSVEDEVGKARSKHVSKQLRSDPYYLICASQRVINDLTKTCDECKEELESRNPRVIAHCKFFFFFFFFFLFSYLFIFFV